MPHMFTEIIDGWASWGRVFQSIDAFAPLIRAIFQRHGLTAAQIEHLTPGTNAVFLVGDWVVKIYAPKESGVEPDGAELTGLRHALGAGVRAPKVVEAGEVDDKYLFPYIVMERIQGDEAGDALPGMPSGKKRAFAAQLKEVTARLNTRCDTLPDDVVQNVLENSRWDAFPRSMKEVAVESALALCHEDFVYVHGDLTSENVLIAPDGELRLIDFGDSHIAPFWYEWPPMVFDLFKCDPVLMEAYFDDCASPGFVSTLAKAVMLHDFGGLIARDLLCKDTETEPAAVKDVAALERLIAKRLAMGKMGES